MSDAAGLHKEIELINSEINKLIKKFEYYKRHIRDPLADEDEFISEYAPACPHCEHEHANEFNRRDEWETYSIQDGDTEMLCEVCGEHFEFYAVMTFVTKVNEGQLK